MAATLDELLLSAEYIAAEGNPQILLCERGVRTFSDHARYTLDLAAVPALRRLTHLPVLVDPSHGSGRRDAVIPLARAAAAVGAHGVIVEVHASPEVALSDGPQAIYPDQFDDLMKDLRGIAAALKRTL
jgi:3-deoxy-7-phosphoheptulonate synthase